MEMRDKLNCLGQGHLLAYWDCLNSIQKDYLRSQIEDLDVNCILQLQKLWGQEKGAQSIQENVQPIVECAQAGNLEMKKKGLEILSQGECGCILVAGGQATRLQDGRPKGMFPVTPVYKKTLFQLFAEKVVAAGKQVGKLLPLAIMTAPSTHEKIIHFFREHRAFGLDPKQIFFFSQSNLPLLDASGNLFLENQDSIAQGPDGNGSALEKFVASGIWKEWYSRGVRYVTFILVDNPLADPFDAELVGFHSQKGGEVVLKCTPRLDANEKVGVIVKLNHQIRVVEYAEMSDTERLAVQPDGSLKHRFANLSLFSFEMNFIKYAASQRDHMPLHIAHKIVKSLNSSLMSCKFERYIFDVLPYASQISLLSYPREHCFAPLKNKEGTDSLSSVQEALQSLDRIVYKNVTGEDPPPGPFELTQEFYYPTQEFL